MPQRHQQTRFPLVGRHALVTCDACHTRASEHRYAGTPLLCIACHQKEYESAARPSHVKFGFPVDCTRCHRLTSLEWPAGFDHTLTEFPLTGAHVSVICSACHLNDEFQRRSSDCYSCHAANFAATSSPDHTRGMFSHDCRSCHNTIGWQPATFDHNNTAFGLTGAHTALQCQNCHTGGNYRLVYSGCWTCHSANFQQTTNPGHAGRNFSHDCRTCHTTVAWQPATFDHTTTTFPLTGAHVAVPCITCHTGNNFQLVYSDCYGCHKTKFDGVTSPNHTTGLFSHTCQPCHSTVAWTPATFDHTATRFALTGKHLTTGCQSCHTGGNYQLVYSGCYTCHQNDYQTTTNPNHVSGAFNRDCTQCHTTTAWSPASFDHTTTKFPLTGKHTTTACQACHIGNYQLVYSGCYLCHQADYTGTTNPNHIASNFSQNCAICHSTTAWTPATFDHTTTKFPLTGTHVTTPCLSCHKTNNYQLAYTDCYACHSADFAKPTNPNHVIALFGHDCTPCHTTTAWTPSTFNHDGQYFKIYSGRHLQQWTLCTDCHPTQSNFAVFTCTTCHIQIETDSHHTAVSGYVYSSPACYSCHRNV